jgi:hypothetical protein
LLPCSVASAQSVDYGGYRPHFQGHGVNTPGGRGGTVCKVTSISDEAWPAAPGTIRHCIENVSGPRFVIFEVSGTIRLRQGVLTIKNPYITIAGQTAPSPGILLRGEGILVDTHDVVIQHVRVRIGNVPWEPHGLWLRNGARQVVIDHVSVSWAVWTGIVVGASSAGRPDDVTIVDSIVAESLACSGVNTLAPCDPESYPAAGWSNSRAVGIGDGASVTLLRNILAHNNQRHPEIGGPTRTLLVNNLIYNPSLMPLSAIYFANAWNEGPTLSVLKGNVMIAGPTTPGHNGYTPPEYVEEGSVKLVQTHDSLHPDSQIYLDGNFYEKDCGGGACLASSSAQWRLVKDWAGGKGYTTTPPIALDNLPLSSALAYSDVESYVTANAGARPLDRDAVDARIMSEIVGRTGSVPNRPSDKAGEGTGGDGFPILAENRRTLTVPGNPNAVVDAAGRTRIEAWLEEFAQALEPGGSGSAPPQPPPSVPTAPASLRIVPEGP